MAALMFWVALLALAPLGAGIGWHPRVRAAPVGARLALAWAGGAVGLAVTAMLCSLFGIEWRVSVLAVPPAVASIGLAVWWWRRECVDRSHPDLGRGRTTVATPPWMIVAAATAVGGGLLHLMLACLTTRGAASDLLFFWGVKAVHFADVGGFVVPSLTGPYAVHTHPSYPPLHPVVLAWSVLVAGELPWRLAPMTSVIYLVAAVPIVNYALRQRMGSQHALAVTGFWTVAIAGALVQSGSGGNAEAALVLFATVALVALLSEQPRSQPLRLFVNLGLVGAVLTKNEGAIAAALIVLGVVVRDRLWWGRWRWSGAASLAVAPAAVGTFWLAVRLQAGLPVTDPIRERALSVSFEHVGTIVRVGASVLQGGTHGAVWLVPAVLLVIALRRRAVLAGLLPALLLVVGLLGFLFVYYLHARGNPTDLITWTLPRVTLPALSALILAAGVATAPGGEEGDSSVGQAGRL